MKMLSGLFAGIFSLTLWATQAFSCAMCVNDMNGKVEAVVQMGQGLFVIQWQGKNNHNEEKTFFKTSNTQVNQNCLKFAESSLLNDGYLVLSLSRNVDDNTSLFSEVNGCGYAKSANSIM